MREDETAILPDGRKLGFAEYGDPKGKAVLFFHGWPSSRYQAAFLDGHAKKRGLRILAPERPGIGLSDPLLGRGFSHWPQDVADFADSQGIDRFPIYGISGGAPYALATCAALGNRVEGAAIASGAPPLVSTDDRAHMHWVYRTLTGMKNLRRLAMPALLPLSRWMIGRGITRAPMSWMLKSIPERDREALYASGGWEMIIRSYLEAIRHGTDSVLAEGELYVEPWDFNPSDIKRPVRFWHGQADSNLPCAVAQKLASMVPDSEGFWIENEGHYSLAIHHTPAILDWLKAP